MPGIGLGISPSMRRHRVNGAAFTAEYQAVWDSFINKPIEADAVAQNDYVGAGVDDGWWPLTDREFIWGVHNAANPADALRDWAHPTLYNASVVNAPTLTAKQGYQGNAIDKAINSNFTPSTDGVNYTALSAGLFLYIRSNITDNGVDAGNFTGTDIWGTSHSSGSAKGSVNNGLDIIYANTDPRGGYYFEVDGAGVNDQTGYKNGIFKGSANSSIPALPNDDVYALSNKNAGGPFSYTARQQSILSLSAALGATKQLSKYNAFQALMTHYGTQV